jgi:serine/threonine-protein kinase
MQRALVWVDRQSREGTLGVPPKQYDSVRVSPDGSRLVLDTNASEGDLWVWDDKRAILGRLTSHPSRDYSPEWTPDGRRVIFTSERDLVRNVYLLNTESVEDATRVQQSGDEQMAASFMSDGRLLLRSQGRERSKLELLRLDDRSEERAFEIAGGIVGRNAVVSPDGRWVASESDESGEVEIVVHPFPDVRRGKWQVSSGGGSQPLWSKRGDELFFVREGALYHVPISTGAAFDFGEAKLLLSGGQYALGGGGRREYDISPDGQRFYFIKESTSRHIVVVQNWFAELKLLLPAN